MEGGSGEGDERGGRGEWREGGREGGREELAMQIEGRFVAQLNLKSLGKLKKTRENISLKS